jgi:hypothetical protein
MGVTRERFAQGLVYDAWKAQMTRNRETFEANERGLELSEADLAPFRALSRPLHVLVLAEDWCGDVVANLPILGRIASETGVLDLRIFLRDQSDDLMSLYLNQGRFKSIPVFAFFDDAFREVGRFLERPASVTELRARKRREIYASDPAFGSRPSRSPTARSSALCAISSPPSPRAREPDRQGRDPVLRGVRLRAADAGAR